MKGPYGAARRCSRFVAHLGRVLRTWGRGSGTPADHAASDGGYSSRTAQARRRFWSELHAGRQLAEENASRGGARARPTQG